MEDIVKMHEKKEIKNVRKIKSFSQNWQSGM